MPGPISAGWYEAVLSVSDIAEMQAFFVEVLGWQLRDQGDVSRDQLDFWHLPQAANARFSVLACPGSTNGLVRLVQFAGVPQRRMREHDQPWETGGIFNINIRVADLEAIAEAGTARGWQGISAPADFTFGPFKVREWIARHRDGIRIAFIQRIDPPLQGWPDGQISSHAFNSSQMVSDMDAALGFYRDALGMEVVMATDGPLEEAGEDVLGFPREAMTSIPRTVRVLSPFGCGMEGSVELFAFAGCSGRDFAEHCRPPNLGLLSLRYRVEDIVAISADLPGCENGVLRRCKEIAIGGGQRARLLATRSPDGAQIELVQPC